MACKYARGAVWWLKYREGDDGWKRESTGLRVDDEVQTAQADLLVAKWSLREKRETPGRPDDFAWVDGFLADHCRSPKTLQAYRLHWRHLRHFFSINGIHDAADVKFIHGSEYVKWRMLPKRHNGKRVSKNTALQETKTLSLILRHAALRGEIKFNPIQNLGIAREDVAEKEEFSDAEITACLTALDREKREDPSREWMWLSFVISLHTGLRLRETALRMKFVDFDRMTITVIPKGGKAREFTRPLPDALVPVLKPLKGRVISHEFPFQPSRCFQNFFGRLGFQHLTFHGLRVTYITRLARAGVPLSGAMRLVNHASQVVHRIYQRLGVEDVRPYANLPLPELPSSTTDRNPAG